MSRLSHLLVCGFFGFTTLATAGCVTDNTQPNASHSGESRTIVIDTQSLPADERIAINVANDDVRYQVNLASFQDMERVEIVSAEGSFSLADHSVWEDGTPVRDDGFSQIQANPSANGTGTTNVIVKCVCIPVCCNGGYSCWCSY